MKKILIVIQDMGGGGAQRSLLSFLEGLEENKRLQQYKIDLMVVRPEGIFYSKIPTEVHIILPPLELLWLGTPSGNPLLKKYPSVKGFFGKAKWSLVKNKLKTKRNLNSEQALWESWKDLIPVYPEKYDVAISYMNGYPNYYVMDKVRADKKVLWVHNEYEKLNYNDDFDRPYYEHCKCIITISDICACSLANVFPEFQHKISILENITCGNLIHNRASEGGADEFSGYEGLKILSIGRLDFQKGFDYAIDAANELSLRGIKYLWLILGEGPDREKLQDQINRYGIDDHIRLIGIRENPYKYIRACDIFAQSSRFEGKSIVLDEAKILAKPIVVTNYDTICDSIHNQNNGLIVEMNGKDIAEAILKLHNDSTMRDMFVRNLLAESNGNEKELEKYITIMF